MTATELIEEINKLSHEEQLEVLEFLGEHIAARKAGDQHEVKVDEEFKRVADKIFTKNDKLFHRLAE